MHYVENNEYDELNANTKTERTGIYEMYFILNFDSHLKIYNIIMTSLQHTCTLHKVHSSDT